MVERVSPLTAYIYGILTVVGLWSAGYILILYLEERREKKWREWQRRQRRGW